MQSKAKKKSVNSKPKDKGKKPVFYEDIGFFGRRWQRKEKEGNKK